MMRAEEAEMTTLVDLSATTEWEVVKSEMPGVSIRRFSARIYHSLALVLRD
jgi:hypothetical protein